MTTPTTALTGKKSATVATSIGDNTITFTVANVGTLTLDLTKISPTMRNRAEMHGWLARMVDAAALGKDKITGEPAPAAAKFEAMRVLIDHYNAGATEWSPARKEGSAREVGGLTLRALAEVYGLAVEVMKGKVEKIIAKRGITLKEYYDVAATIPAVAEKIVEMKSRGVDANIAKSIMDELENEIEE